VGEVEWGAEVAMTSRIEREQIERAVRAICEGWRGVPSVVGHRMSICPYSTGETAVFVTVIPDEQTEDKDWTSRNLDPLCDTIREAIAATGSDRWGYTFFRKPSDLAEGAVA